MKFKSLLASCLLLCALFVSSSLLADDRFVSTEISLKSIETIANYWTKERMGNAVPYPMPLLEGTPQLFPAGTVPVPADGEPGSEPGRLPRLGLKASLSSKDKSVKPLHVFTNPYDCRFPFTRFAVLITLYNTYPYRTVGKVFFTSGGQNFVCSGSSVVSPSNRAVLTAGHCVSDGNGNFHTNWVFRPSFRCPNKAPKGTWAATSLGTFAAWHNNSQFCRDVGFATVRKVGVTPPGPTLTSQVGALGFIWNLDSTRVHWNIFGYPAAPPFHGCELIECQASFAAWDEPDCNTPRTHCVGCDQTGGSSGGPWIKNFVPGVVGSMNFANSVVSYGYRDRPCEMYGPYFDTAVKDLKDLY